MENNFKIKAVDMNVYEFIDSLSKKLINAYESESKQIDISYSKVRDTEIMQNGLAIEFLDSPAGAIIYPQKLYETNESIDTIASNEKEKIDNLLQTIVFDNMSKKELQDNLFIELTNAEMYPTLKSLCANQQINDLMLIPRLKLNTEKNYIASVIVSHKAQAELFHMTDDEILAIAKSNTFAQNQYICRGMNEIMASITEIDEIKNDSELMYVVTNERATYGATAIANKEVMNTICQKIGEREFFVIPSSISEVIVVPSSIVDDPADLQKCCIDVNKTLNESDVLSNNIYRYNGKQLCICNSQKELNEQIIKENQSKIISSDIQMKRTIK